MQTKQTNRVQSRIRSVHEGLDLGFSDYYRDQNVRDRTIAKHLKALEEGERMLGVEEAMNFSLWHALGPQHASPNIYVLDFPSDLRAALYSLLGGYYRQALLCLRNWLEMRLLGIYFGCIERDSAKYRAWKLGDAEGPFGRVLIRRLFARADFRAADTQLGLRSRLEDLYSHLSAFTHGAGLERHRLQADTDNVPRYNRASVLLWIRTMHGVFAEITFWLFLAYGKDALRDLSADEMETLLAHLPQPYRNLVQASP